MSARAKKRLLIGVGILIALGFECGIIQRAISPRSIVSDAVSGGDFWIVEVDGEPTGRVQHGFLVSFVPLPLIKPGERILTLAKMAHPSADEKTIEMRVTIEKWKDYRIVSDEEGNPALVAEHWKGPQ
ncbi:hypothetical protein N9Z18_00180 [Verrucomicrobiales bacterium]|jgi:hypothetical protein|nr:hypothetical protein [Verrucomicrobiales bacterium]